MICPNCGCNVRTGAIPVSEVELPMSVDPRNRDPEHWMTEEEAAAENASGPVMTWIRDAKGYGGHGQIRVDPNHPDCQLYDEAMKPGRAEELVELRRLMEL